MRLIPLIIFLFLATSCLKKEQSSNIKLNNTEYPIIDNFIKNLKKFSIQKNENVLIDVYLEKLDTIIVLRQNSPENCKNLKSSFRYKSFNIFIFSSLKDINIFFPSIENENLCNENINNSVQDLPYEEYFIVENNKIVPQY